MTTLIDLRGALTEALTAEKAAISRRRDIEKQILNHPEIVASINEKPTGSRTMQKLTVTTGFNRSFDQKKLHAVASDIPPELWPFEITYRENRAGTAWLESNRPDLWEKISPALSVKEKTPSVKVKE